MDRELIRRIPKIDEILQTGQIAQAQAIPHTLLLEAAREVTDRLRREILAGAAVEEERLSPVGAAEAVLQAAAHKYELHMRRVINATGIALHTNLGRAPLSQQARDNIAETAGRYSNLEYDLEEGERGSRHRHLESLIRRITGAEAAMAVNNNAAATILCLAALSRGRKTIVSRGELVEIGGSFRIPEIMSESGALLTEVGTTNKTKLSDYRAAIDEDTALLLKVHTSNYRIVGFTEEVPLEELTALGHDRGLPVVFDLGSGLMTDLRPYGIDEPTVFDGLEAGADIVMMSGDKLLGGPQAGILTGKRVYIDRLRVHPLARAFRIDKMTIAALEATFRAYYDEERALKEIPVLRMLTCSEAELRGRAEALAVQLASCGALRCEAVSTSNQAGGGSAPGVQFPGYAVALLPEKASVESLEKHLREAAVPVIGRISQGRLLLELRTIQAGEEGLLAQSLREALAKAEAEA